MPPGDCGLDDHALDSPPEPGALAGRLTASGGEPGRPGGGGGERRRPLMPIEILADEATGLATGATSFSFASTSFRIAEMSI